VAENRVPATRTSTVLKGAEARERGFNRRVHLISVTSAAHVFKRLVPLVRSIGMRVRRNLSALSVAALGLVILVTGRAATATAKAPHLKTVSELTASQHRAAENLAAAECDARSLLDRLVLPAGATRIAAEPHGDHTYLSVDPQGGVNATVHGWWEVSESPVELIAFLRSHPPAGGVQSETGDEGNSRIGTSAETLTYQWPTIRGVLDLRELDLAVTALPNGRTGVLAQSFSSWVRPRPSSEQIPADTDEIEVTIGNPHAPTRSLSVTNASQVQKIVKVINSLSIVQGGALSCVLETDPLQLTMTFRTASQGKPVAVLTYLDYRRWSGPSDACKPVALTLSGRKQDPLIGGYFLRTIGRILGRSLT
jgi:hypothetical protein